MTTISPRQLKASMRDGLLSFPLTDFDAEDRFDAETYGRRLEWLDAYKPKAMFTAGGAGEFFSLTMEEYRRVVSVAVEARLNAPIIAATGYGTRMAKDMAIAAEQMGADGLLLLPPYLTEGSQEGLFQHVRSVCESTGLGVIVYNRANCRITADTLMRLADACPNLIGFKDGGGDIEEMSKIVARVDERLLCINGMPTAEVYALAYKGLGITSYTSAIFNFIPRSAMAFHKAVIEGDTAFTSRFMKEFFAPYAAIRSRQPGYAVSIVKAGANIVGRSAGKVRPPLSDLTREEHEALGTLIALAGPQ